MLEGESGVRGGCELSSEAGELPAEGVEGMAIGRDMAIEYKNMRDVDEKKRGEVPLGVGGRLSLSKKDRNGYARRSQRMPLAIKRSG